MGSILKCACFIFWPTLYIFISCFRLAGWSKRYSPRTHTRQNNSKAWMTVLSQWMHRLDFSHNFSILSFDNTTAMYIYM